MTTFGQSGKDQTSGMSRCRTGGTVVACIAVLLCARLSVSLEDVCPRVSGTGYKQTPTCSLLRFRVFWVVGRIMFYLVPNAPPVYGLPFTQDPNGSLVLSGLRSVTHESGVAFQYRSH